MGFLQCNGVYEDDSDPTPEEIMSQYEMYIVALVEKTALRSSNIFYPGAVGLDSSDIVQNVLIKFWQALERQPIEHPKSYIQTIVRNEFCDRARKGELAHPLPVDDDGELYMAHVQADESVDLADPAEAYVVEESLDVWLSVTADVVSNHLSPRQQRAIACLLNEVVDERIPLVRAFEEYDMDIETFVWPHDEDEKRLLKASISAARHNIARLLDVDLPSYRRRGIPDTFLVSVKK